MQDIVMPASFPGTEFREFALAARAFFPDTQTFEGLQEMFNDPQEKQRQFDYPWQAVRYRYRICSESNDELKALLGNTSEMWQAGWGDEELVYRLERCIYQFFTAALSVFDSFAFCLYFCGHAIRPCAFQDFADPRKITRKSTALAYCAAFPEAQITLLLAKLPKDSRFSAIDKVRNLVGHRLSGRRTVRGTGTRDAAGRYTYKEERTWHIPGLTEPLMFDEDLLQRQLDNINGLLAPMVSAAREFAEAQKAARKPLMEPAS